ncbi:Tudor domain-containing protein 7 [Nymphon striatum]|nr:Tudor domain-containing protein 7 [Nymphon striatum]
MTTSVQSFNNIKMEAANELRKETIKDLRSVVTSHKGAIPLTNLEKDYVFLIGTPIPFKSMGFSSLEDMFSSMSADFRVKRSYGSSEIIIEEVANITTAHITELVSRQKTVKKAPVRKRFNKRTPRMRPIRENHPMRITRTIQQNGRSSTSRNYHGQSFSSATTSDRQRQDNHVPPLSSITFSDSKNHSFEVPHNFQKLARNSMINKRKRAVHSPDEKQSSSSSGSSSPVQGTAKKDLSDYTTLHGLKLSAYKTILFKMKNSVSLYCSTVKVDNHQYSTYPEELKSKDEAERLAAAIALKELKLNEKNRAAATKVMSDYTLVIDRIIEIIGDRTAGVFNIGVEKEYRSIYNESLPINWLKSMSNECSTVLIEKVDGKRSILYPKPKEQIRRTTTPERTAPSSTERTAPSPTERTAPSPTERTAPSPTERTAPLPTEVNPPDSKISTDRPDSSNSCISAKSISRSESTISPPPLVLPNEDTIDVFVTHVHRANDIVVRLADFSVSYNFLFVLSFFSFFTAHGFSKVTKTKLVHKSTHSSKSFIYFVSVL